MSVAPCILQATGLGRLWISTLSLDRSHMLISRTRDTVGNWSTPLPTKIKALETIKLVRWFIIMGWAWASSTLLICYWRECQVVSVIYQANKMGLTPQYFNTIPIPCAILPTMPYFCCVHRRIMEGSGVGSAGCVVHVDMHAEWVALRVAATY